MECNFTNIKQILRIQYQYKIIKTLNRSTSINKYEQKWKNQKKTKQKVHTNKYKQVCVCMYIYIYIYIYMSVCLLFVMYL